MMRVYLAGPMRGLPDCNFAEFARWTTLLREPGSGYDVVSPAELSATLDRQRGVEAHSLSFQEYLRNDIKQLLECDIVALLPGWERSIGAKAEVALAKTLHIPIRSVDAVASDA